MLHVGEQILKDAADLFDLQIVLIEVPNLPSQGIGLLDYRIVHLFNGEEDVRVQVKVHKLLEHSLHSLNKLILKVISISENRLKDDISELIEHEVSQQIMIDGNVAEENVDELEKLLHAGDISTKEKILRIFDIQQQLFE